MFFEYLKKIFVNLPGWHTNRKIIVIESDDWGSIRMPSREVYNKLLNKGYPVDKCVYNRNDCLESNEDLELLFNVLLKFKDLKGNHPVITANTIVANPDFNKIRESKFSSYSYEVFINTLLRYPNSDKVYDLYKKGIDLRIFIPQFHGREHVNTTNWIEALKRRDYSALEIFDYGMFTVHKPNNISCRKEFLDSFGTHTSEEFYGMAEAIDDGLNIFEKLFGYRSRSFIATCYIWHPEVEKYLYSGGVRHIQSSRVQKIPQLGFDSYDIMRLYTGKKNKLGQVYTCRNVIFEPAENPDKDWVDSALKEISLAFTLKKPAIVSAHRVNFIGSIHEENRSRNLQLFEELLNRVLQKWPDVEFMNSEQLGKLILNAV